MKRVLFALFLSMGTGSVPASDSRALDAGNTELILALEGKMATVQGVVTSSTVSKSGRHFLNFAEPFYTGFTLMVEADNAPAVFGAAYRTGDLNGKTVRVRGPVEIYRDRPRIVLRDAESLSVLD